jgi:hypothetical protein
MSTYVQFIVLFVQRQKQCKKICITNVYKIEFNQPNTLLQTQYMLQSTSICVYFVEKCSKHKLDNESFMAKDVNYRLEQSKRKGYTAQIVFTVESDDLVLW